MSRGTKRTSHEAFGRDNKGESVAKSTQDVLSKHRSSLTHHSIGGIQHGGIGKAIDFDAPARPGTPTSNKSESQQSSTNTPRNLKSLAATHLLTRKLLPIWSHQDTIRAALRTHNVLLLVGETGSGKSTQVPQFLLNESFCQSRNVTLGSDNGTKVSLGGRIAITQPRRVAATSLARRVAEEMGTPLGGGRGEVGYSVRFDAQVGPRTRVKFLTEGMLLQELLRDPGLRAYSVVVVDEVHERGVDVDLCLGFLRGLCDAGSGVVRRERGGVALKVVVMSATAEMGRLERYFGGSGGKGVEGEGAEEVGGEDGDDGEFAGFSDDEDAKKTSRAGKGQPRATKKKKKNGVMAQVTTLHIPGRLFPVEINYLPTPTSDIITAALERIIHIHVHLPLPGDVLVFLPGQESIESLHSLLKTYAANLNKPDPTINNGTTTGHHAKAKPSSINNGPRIPDLLPLPLHASLPTHLQHLAFLPPPTNPTFTRKVILATNIAETSLTLPGILYVIDSGLCKQRFFRPSLGMESLVVKEISQSSAKQRAGRAGRERKGGRVWRLYTERDYEGLDSVEEEEIRRGDLRGVVLALRGRGVKGEGFEEAKEGPDKAEDNDDEQPGEERNGRDQWKWVTKPKLKAWRAALLGLMQVGALHVATGEITSVGRELSLLPLPVPLGRCLISSVALGVVPQIVDIVSALSVEGVFLNLGHRERNTSSPDEHNSRGDANSDEEETTLDPRLKLRQRLYRREGDHLTLLATMQAYVSENSDRKRWCNERGISHRAMQGAMDVRKQLRGIVERKVKERKSLRPPEEGQNGEKPSSELPAVSSTEDATDAATTRAVLTCLLTGLHPNVALLTTSSTSSTSSSTATKTAKKASANSGSSNAGGGPAQYLTLHTNQPIAIHPSSVLFGRKVEAIMSSEVVFTTRSYARCVSAVELGWVGDAQRVISGEEGA